MIRRVKTERAAQQQKAICDGFMAVMLEKDYPQITVQDICAQTGIPRRTFYYYFDGKEEVLELLLENMVRECSLESMIPVGGKRQIMVEGFSRFFAYWRDVRGGQLQALLRNGFAGRIIDTASRWITTESLWVEQLDHSTGLDAMNVQLGTTVVFYVLFYWCQGGFRQSEIEAAQYTTTLLTKPLYEL